MIWLYLPMTRLQSTRFKVFGYWLPRSAAKIQRRESSHTLCKNLESIPGTRLGRGEGGNASARHFSGGRQFWSKEGIANGFSRMNLKLDLRFRFWLRLDLPYVWPRLSRFKRLSRCPFPVSNMSRNFTSVKFSKLTPAWWCIVMK